MNALVPTITGINLHALAGDDGDIWTLERIRNTTKYPNWTLAIDSLEATRNYDLALSFSISIFIRSFDYTSEMSKDELERIHHITSSFILSMLDKADMWEEFLAWFWFLRHHTESYLRYDLHIGSHNDSDLEQFIDDKGDHYTWVHNMYVYNHRRRIVERKLSRRRTGMERKSDLHHPKSELSHMDLRRRLENVFAHFRIKQEAQAYWQAFWQSNGS